MIPLWVILLGFASKSINLGMRIVRERTSTKLGHIDCRPWVFNVGAISQILSAAYFLYLNTKIYEPVSLLGHAIGLGFTWRWMRISKWSV